MCVHGSVVCVSVYLCEGVWCMCVGVCVSGAWFVCMLFFCGV